MSLLPASFLNLENSSILPVEENKPLSVQTIEKEDFEITTYSVLRSLSKYQHIVCTLPGT